MHSFVSEQGNKDPWGVLYRILRHKCRKNVLLSAFSIRHGVISDVSEILHHYLMIYSLPLLNDLLPDDNEAGETACHLQVRHEVTLFCGDC